MGTLKAYYLDASALIKMFIQEKRSDIVRNLTASNSQIYTTNLCVAEALRVFKRVHLLKKNPPDTEAYANCCLDLISTIIDENIQIDDQPIINRENYDKAEQLILAHKLDLSDVLQILSVKASFPKRIGLETILITDDENLFCAAKTESIQSVWLQDQGAEKKLGLKK
ncbi:MAG: PIN domain-containing protein [Thermotogota bacterium]|nr:PIN domain-containing protein [Thermotogota bacterium]